MSDTTKRQFGELTVIIDRQLCCSSEACLEAAPEAFELDAETVVSFKENGGETPREKLIEACSDCPVEALTVTDGDGKQLVP